MAEGRRVLGKTRTQMAVCQTHVLFFIFKMGSLLFIRVIGIVFILEIIIRLISVLGSSQRRSVGRSSAFHPKTWSYHF